MGNYCTAINITNQAVLDYLRNKTFEIIHQKAFGEEPLDWRFDAFWKKRLSAPKVLKDKQTFEDMTSFVSSFPEMKKNKNQKILKDCKKWPYTCCGIIKSKFLIELDSLDNSNKNDNNKLDDECEIQKDVFFSDLKSYIKSRSKEIIGAGYLIGNSVVLTLVKNIYLKKQQGKNNFNLKKGKEKDLLTEIKATEVKFYAYFNGNTGIECEVDAIHHLDFSNIEEIFEDFALLFLKKPIGEELGFLGVWDKFDFAAAESLNAELIGYLYDDIYENKIYLNELKIHIKCEKNDALFLNCENYNNNDNKATVAVGPNGINSIEDKRKIQGTANEANNLQNKFYKSFTNLKQTSKSSITRENPQNLGGVDEENNNNKPLTETEKETEKPKQIINNKNTLTDPFYPEFFTFQADQQFNLLPGAAIWYSNHPSKHFILGLYIGKHKKTSQHFGRFLPQSIPNLKEWILDYWHENKKENTRLLLSTGSGGEAEFKQHKTDFLHVIVNKYTKLTHMNLSENNLTDDDVLLLVKNLTSLKSLKLRNNYLTTNTAIHIANNQRGIEELDLSGNNIGYVGIKEIAAKLRKIKLLFLEKTALKNNSLADIAANLIDLTVLDVSRNFVTDEGVFHVSAGNVNLSELNLTGNELVGDEALGFLGENSLRLQTLLVGECNVSDFGLEALSRRALFIRKLSLARCANVTDAGLNLVLGGLKFLDSLNILHCGSVSDEFKRSLVKAKIVKNLVT